MLPVLVALALQAASPPPSLLPDPDRVEAGAPARPPTLPPGGQALLADGPPRSRSVYRVSPWLDGAAIGAGLLATSPYLFADKLIRPRCPCDPSEVNPIDRTVIGNHSNAADAISDATVGLALLAPLALDAWDVGLSRELVEDFVIDAEVLSVSGGLVTIAKYTVQRPIPRVYAGQAPALIDKPGGYRSFYSGHTTLTVAALTTAATTYTLRHGDSLWPWLITAVVTASVAFERIEAGFHFYSDVVVGAAAGTVVAVVLTRLHLRPSLSGQLAIAPSDGGMRLSWTQGF